MLKKATFIAAIAVMAGPAFAYTAAEKTNAVATLSLVSGLGLFLLLLPFVILYYLFKHFGFLGGCVALVMFGFVSPFLLRPFT